MTQFCFVAGCDHNRHPDAVPKGLILSVYRDARLGDCTNGGITSKVDQVTVVGVRDGYGALDPQWAGSRKTSPVQPLPSSMRVFPAREGSPAVVLVVRDNGLHRWLSLEPLEGGPDGSVWWMAGGNYAGSHDSRWTELTDPHGSGGPVSVHDRAETAEQYRQLSA